MNRTNAKLRGKNEQLQDMHRIDKGDALTPAWIAFTKVTNLNIPSSENHLNFHVWEPEIAFVSSAPSIFFLALPEQ